MKIYTGKGDNGQSSLIGKEEISKSRPIFDLLGSLDELNASLGLVKAPKSKEINILVSEIQRDLFSIGALLADIESNNVYSGWDRKTRNIEQNIDNFQSILPELKNFILPGGSATSAQFHLSRAVCRRFERELVRFIESEGRADLEPLLSYFNRLSDLFFVLARYSNFKSGVKDVIWDGKP
ncbi:MAG TPA: cob(I)yrinic acid a,c-diamide adenosyltransferase [Patescibacteria group bacterium]|nr:cob(I)yrinic acid a,c-diamide adenosyltransferase [Patescibacteria group bacterium]